MKLFEGIVLVILFLVFTFVLQKWRKSIKESTQAIDGKKLNRKKEMKVTLIDIFSFNFIVLACIILYFLLVH